MSDLYAVAGISKQALHQHRSRQLQKATAAYGFFEKADKIRKMHPGAGCRRMAEDLRIPGWGRDKVEKLLLSNGYRLYYPPNYMRTTYSQQDVYYDNLIEGLELTAINQVVQTDITYFKVGERFYYLVFLIDVYSRQIVGYAASKTLAAEGNIKALKMMLQKRKGQCLKGLIHHSDRGSQYIDKEYTKLLRDNEIVPSMCKAAWENAYTERINRTIKNDYLKRWVIKDYKSLVAQLRKAVVHYNTIRKHRSLNKQSPVEFEKNVNKLPEAHRPKELIYKSKEAYPH